MEAKEYFYLRALLATDGVGPTRIRNLLAEFGSFEKVFHSSPHHIANVELFSSETAKKIFQKKEEFNELEKKIESEIALFEKCNARVVGFWDESYPFLLKKIYDPPLLLFVSGDISILENTAVAVIGTRVPTAYGRQMTEKITTGLVERGITIVSGFARGIDTIAHNTVLRHGGATAAVLGSGLDVVYPAENKKIVAPLLHNGALISEYPFGTKPDAGNFPRRNRIISGLSKAVIVIETKMTGGAMITAKLALDQGRDVFALPGNAGVLQAEGTNHLIKSSIAKLITSAKDVLEDLGIPVTADSQKKSAMSPDISQLNIFESKIYSVLTAQPQQIDLLSAASGLSVSDCLVHLLGLEFKNLARQYPGKMFARE